MTSEAVFSFDVGGMTCSACSTRIEKLLNRLPGVVEANVNLAMERAEVRADQGAVTEALLEETLANAGFPPQPLPRRTDNAEETQQAAAQALRKGAAVTHGFRIADPAAGRADGGHVHGSWLSFITVG